MCEHRKQESVDIIESTELDDLKKELNAYLKDGWSLLSIDKSHYTMDGFLITKYMATMIKYKD